jgi:hypothetical protein
MSDTDDGPRPMTADDLLSLHGELARNLDEAVTLLASVDAFKGANLKQLHEQMKTLARLTVGLTSGLCDVVGAMAGGQTARPVITVDRSCDDRRNEVVEG